MAKLQKVIREYKEAVTLHNADLEKIKAEILRLGAELGIPQVQIEAVFMLYA